jgi:nitric oxide reductase NorQ protein
MKFTNDTLAKVEIKDGVVTVVTLSGKDVTTLVKANAKLKAMEHGETFMFLDEKGIWKREGYLNSTQQDVAQKMIKEHKTEPVAPKAPVVENPVMNLIANAVEKKPLDLFCTDLKWKFLVRSVLRGKNIMMTGAAGTGKTYTAQQVAKGMEKPFFYFNLGATQDPRATLIGTTQFKEGEGTLFNQSLFVQAIQTEGAVVLLDELSRANPEAANILMTVLDEGQRYLRLDEQEGAPTIKVAKGVSFIATANIGNEYTATRVMDRALMDRFTIVEVDALDAEGEKSLLMQNYPELDERFASAIAEIADASRKELKTDMPRISTAISTRSTLELAGLIYDGFKLSEAAEVAVLPFFDNDGGMDSERTYIQQLIQKHSHLDNPVIEGNEFDTDEDLFNIEDDSY